MTGFTVLLTGNSFELKTFPINIFAEDLRQAIVAMMLRKDEIEENNK